MQLELDENGVKLVLKLLKVSDPLDLYTISLQNNIIKQLKQSSQIELKEKKG